MRLEGKLAIVTAAASGMGRAGVERFVREGAGCLIWNRRGEPNTACHFIECFVRQKGSKNPSRRAL